MFEISSFKIICTDSTEILFSYILLIFFFKTRVCWFELSLARTKFFTDPYCAGVSNKHCLLTFFRFSKKYIILCILKGEVSFKMHKIIFFPEKKII